MSNDCKTVKYTILKAFSHFSVTTVDCIVALLISEMIKIFVYLKTEKIYGKYFKIILINENIYYNINGTLY